MEYGELGRAGAGGSRLIIGCGNCGGGLTTRIASAARELLLGAAVYTVEPATADPLAVAM